MDVVQDEEINLTANITDHYTEANVAIQDNIALPPVEVQTRGLVAELLLDPSAAEDVDAPTGAPDEALPEIEEQGPEFTPQADQQQAQNQSSQDLFAAAVAGEDSLAQYQQDLVSQQPGQTRQSNAFGYFVQLWKGRQLFTVETPWGFFANMALKGLTGRQGKDSRYQTEFSLTFKQIRFAGSATVSIGQIAGRAADYFSASSPVVNQAGNASVTSAQAASLWSGWGVPAASIPSP